MKKFEKVTSSDAKKWSYLDGKIVVSELNNDENSASDREKAQEKRHPLTEENIKNMNKLNSLLSDAYIQGEVDFFSAKEKLQHAPARKIPDGIRPCVVDSIKNGKVYLMIGTYGEKKELFTIDVNISSFDELPKPDSLVYMNFRHEKGSDGKMKIVGNQVDPRKYFLKKEGLNVGQYINYTPKKGGPFYRGKITGYAQDTNKEQLIFQTNNGLKFALKYSTLKSGIEKYKIDSTKNIYDNLQNTENTLEKPDHIIQKSVEKKENIGKKSVDKKKPLYDGF